MTFKKYYHFCEIALSVPLGVAVPNNNAFGAVSGPYGGAETSPVRPHRNTTELEIPTTTKTARIQNINDKNNPIFVFLSDGTRLFFPYDAYKKIKGSPEVGKTMTIVFQRRMEDKSLNPSQIQSITCF